MVTAKAKNITMITLNHQHNHNESKQIKEEKTTQTIKIVIPSSTV
jgi:hypothetical protein